MAPAAKILLIHDDAETGRRLATALALHEDCPITCTGLAATPMVLANNRYDIIILAAGAAGADGFIRDLLQNTGNSAPILGAAGAGDNDTAVLLALLRDHLAALERPVEVRWLIAGMVFDPRRRRLTGTSEGAPQTRLTPKESAILAYLCEAGDVVIPRQVLLGEVWGYKPGVTTHTLETHIYHLRQKFEPDPGQATYLLTESGGYRLRGARRHRSL